MRLSPWIVIEGHCATRVLEGTDPAVVANRIAFIEKTPRVRLERRRGHFSLERPDGIGCGEAPTDGWLSGPRGCGGSLEVDGETIYGFYPPSRQWCDAMLRLLGYEID